MRAYRAVLHPPRCPVWRTAIAAAFGAGAFVAGGLFFRYMKRGFADIYDAPEAVALAVAIVELLVPQMPLRMF